MLLAEVRNYICDECGQTFKQRKHLSVHQMRPLRSQTAAVSMSRCAGDGVSERRSLRLCVFSGARCAAFQCRQRASLKYHMTKHKAEADLEFACVICGKRFEKAHNLNVHMSMVHSSPARAAAFLLQTVCWTQTSGSYQPLLPHPREMLSQQHRELTE